jgi:hypothetical protein
VTVELIGAELVAAANDMLRRLGRHQRVENISQLQKEVSATAAMWYYEIKRVSGSPAKLESLVKQRGRGLTPLYRRIGPTQHHALHSRIGTRSHRRGIRPVSGFKLSR